jgi:hypothetical protein
LFYKKENSFYKKIFLKKNFRMFSKKEFSFREEGNEQ